MRKDTSDQDMRGEECQSAGEYSHGQEVINNLPYLVMVVLGAGIFIVCWGTSIWGWVAASAYLVYGLGGIWWIIMFLCPYCRYWNTRSCPCGYGWVAGKLRRKKDVERFKEKFKKHIAVIVPLWFVPVLVGVPVLIRGFSWPLLLLLVAFAVDAFVVLPLLSRKHGCVDCPQKDSCPWMGRKGQRRAGAG